MKNADLYEEALESGLTRREASYLTAAQSLAEIAREMKERQADFLSEVGMSLEEAIALDAEGRAALNEQWAAYCERSEQPVAAAP